ncbi:glucan biosynthesis protein [Jiella avicenniae]|uniref:Glucan biosynthesis protein n=1 Tax=Jiella avicenniae TaxID=2907202 RepID=A0A9X1TCJ7_9HYPH|nr:glucan biosynthesis protein [Jiella avicenniae]MCE7029128.1 glucan biosynthesis protein [Jiella avicenniae]
MLLSRRGLLTLGLVPLAMGLPDPAWPKGEAEARQEDGPEFRRLPGGEALEYGEPSKFSFERLAAVARDKLETPYVPAPDPAPDVLYKIGYDQHGEIWQPARKALFAEGSRDGAVSFFHLGELMRRPVKVFAVEDGEAREVLYRRGYFSFPENNPAREMPDDAGFAGIRVHEPSDGGTGQPGDWLAFLGASYFRSSGDLKQYGISARGLAIDTAAQDGGPEEFPDFTRFYVEPMRGGVITIHALLEGPSVTGAFRFEVTHFPFVKMDVTARLFMRKGVQRFGVAPLTSMFWHSEQKNWVGGDFRPEIHDSDGLVVTREGMPPLFRALTNPSEVTVTRYPAKGLKTFALVQRDRNFENYQDPAAFERRPNLVVQPVEGFDQGEIQLVELPTNAEYGDNIVAFFVPEEPVSAGDEMALRYRLFWSGNENPTPLARLDGLRYGRNRPNYGAIEGERDERTILADFVGAELAVREPSTDFVSIESDAFRIFKPSVSRLPGRMDAWRLSFDLFTTDREPADVRIILKDGEKILSEEAEFRVWPDPEK